MENKFLTKKHRTQVFRYIIYLAILLEQTISAKQITVAHGYWEGVSFFIPVSRKIVQDRLNQWHDQNGDCQSPRLFLPDSPIFPGLIKEDQHPMYFDFGPVTFTDFENGMDPHNPLFYGLEISVSIPFLTGTQSHLPFHSLALSIFYERSRGDFPKPNFMFNYLPVDEILLDGGKLEMRNGSDVLKITFQRLHDSCVPPPDIEQQEYDEYLTMDYQSGLIKPDFDYCDCHRTRNDFCAMAEQLKPDIDDNLGNMCQIWGFPNKEQCETSVNVETVTRGFREAMLLFEVEDAINAIASDYSGNFTIGLKYPCLQE
ncbi:uncharacterized protein [Apostichopus japonicus]|uniref:uncharacterized protein n=1 Tax=Stichopus japonicus TaxID=307972 RepID=UPI003AB903F6